MGLNLFITLVFYFSVILDNLVHLYFILFKMGMIFPTSEGCFEVKLNNTVCKAPNT
jgi:hypothetical protein